MRSYSLGMALVGLLGLAVAGCDSNPDGPSAPPVKAGDSDANISNTPASPGGSSTTKVRGKGNDNAPLRAD